MSLNPDCELLLTGIPESLAESFSERFNIDLYSHDAREDAYDIVLWYQQQGCIYGYSLSTENLADRRANPNIALNVLSGSPHDQVDKAIRILYELLDKEDKEEDEEEEDEEAEENAAELKDIAWAADHAEDSPEFSAERSPEQWDDSTVPTIFDTKDLEDQLP